MQQMFDYQDEEELATGIPKLITFLKDSDTIVVQQACQVHNRYIQMKSIVFYVYFQDYLL